MLMVTLVAKMIVEGFAQMITVLHGGGGLLGPPKVIM